MKQISIRQIHGDEIYNHYFPLTDYALAASPPLSTRETREDRYRYSSTRTILMLYEDEQPMATAAYIPMTQNVRGSIMPMAGVAPVASHPAGRRQGYARQVIRQLFATMHENGYPVTGLHPFRESFYERLGYVTFPQLRIASFSPANLRPLLRMNLPGSVAHTDMQAGYDDFRSFMQRHQQQVHGMSYFPEGTALRLSDKNDWWLACARDESGEVIGVFRYRIQDFGGRMEIVDFCYSSSQAKYLLLHWIARHIDQVRIAELRLPPDALPETWLSDLEARITTEDWVTPMSRVLTVTGLAGIEVGEGAFSARITDADCPWNEGVYRFSGEAGALQVEPAQKAELELTIQGLTALVYGAHDVMDMPYRGWGQFSVEQADVMQSLFPRRLAHMHEAY